METDLYRHWDAEGRLLYVGISLSTAQRLAQHRSNSEWYRAITHITIERFPTRDDALAAEQRAIQTEYPVWNTVHSAEGVSFKGAPAVPVFQGVLGFKLEVDFVNRKAPVRRLVAIGDDTYRISQSEYCQLQACGVEYETALAIYERRKASRAKMGKPGHSSRAERQGAAA